MLPDHRAGEHSIFDYPSFQLTYLPLSTSPLIWVNRVSQHCKANQGPFIYEYKAAVNDLTLKCLDAILKLPAASYGGSSPVRNYV